MSLCQDGGQKYPRGSGRTKFDRPKATAAGLRPRPKSQSSPRFLQGSTAAPPGDSQVPRREGPKGIAAPAAAHKECRGLRGEEQLPSALVEAQRRGLAVWTGACTNSLHRGGALELAASGTSAPDLQTAPGIQGWRCRGTGGCSAQRGAL